MIKAPENTYFPQHFYREVNKDTVARRKITVFRARLDGLSEVKTMGKEQLEFYDVKSKKKFKTTDYRIVNKGGRMFAVTKSQSGTHECWRVVSKDFAAKNK